ncbi:MAG: hypothetical protein HQK53_02615 [Oligoflexia bacterium]|nr:hypothetical protein [Oligoflexia bacterium]
MVENIGREQESEQENEQNTLGLNGLKIKTFDHVDKRKIKEQLERISKLRPSDLLDSSENEFKNNVTEMFAIIKDLENNYRGTLELNTVLRGELQESRQHIKEVTSTNKELQKKLSCLENTSPLLGEIEQRMELALQEREKYKDLYQEVELRNQNLSKNIELQNQLLDKRKEEIEDAHKEIIILEDKCKHYHGDEFDRIKQLELKVQEAIAEKEKIAQELADSKAALREIHKELRSE